MIQYQEAIDLLDQNIKTLKIEKTSIFEGINRVIAEDIFASQNYPSFSKSAMDGYALGSENQKSYEVIGEIAAGDHKDFLLQKNQCVRIFTGARVPESCKQVIRQEYVNANNNYIEVHTKDNLNIIKEGVDLKLGDLVISKNTKLKPQDLSILASFGITDIKTYQKPKVGIIATGSELVSPNQTPNIGQIRNSNSILVSSILKSRGFDCIDYGIINDNEENIIKALKKALNDNDLVITTGGVSVGDYDLIPKILVNQSLDKVFHGVALQPGKPVCFFKGEKEIFFGLPGNPVASFVNTYLFVLPALNQLMGLNVKQKCLKAPISQAQSFKTQTRLKLIPAKLLVDGTLKLINMHGSAHLHCLCEANVLVKIPQEGGDFKQGYKLEYIQLEIL
ncbi:MAG: molybdopterin molybdenumtransferase MoeA [Candidatus Cloacimonadota bacterium]|nr:MAG: molybdopterin molybdenumtransferase MoeA [Candidatus Cloacimonadota bacterium]